MPSRLNKDKALFALKWLRINARRLNDDAAILLKFSRYPSAINLSILSIEESLKFCCAYYEWRHSTKLANKKNRHEEKFKKKGILNFRNTLRTIAAEAKGNVDTWRKMATNGEWHLKESEVEVAIRGVDMILSNTLSNEEIIRIYFSDFEDVFSDVKGEDVFSDVKGLDEFINGGASEINTVRKMSIYTDLGDDGEMVSTPFVLTKEIAEKFASASSESIDFINGITLPNEAETQQDEEGVTAP